LTEIIARQLLGVFAASGGEYYNRNSQYPSQLKSAERLKQLGDGVLGTHGGNMIIRKTKVGFLIHPLIQLCRLPRPALTFFVGLQFIMSMVVAIDVFAETPVSMPSIFQLTLNRIDGSKVAMRRYQGKVILVVNTASKCGFTPQYKDLEVLYQRYRDRGFEVLGFPSNDFRNQEPGSDGDIAKLCKEKFGVTFPLFAKAPVTGPQMQPFYRSLLGHAPDELSDPPAWNFEKILLGKSGIVVARFGSFVNPLSDRITSVIDREIEQPMQSVER
jgi:glutathione peroxidase